MDSDTKPGIIRRGLNRFWLGIRPPSNECQWCSATISTGNPHHPFCSEQCKIDQWQAEQW